MLVCASDTTPKKIIRSPPPIYLQGWLCCFTLTYTLKHNVKLVLIFFRGASCLGNEEHRTEKLGPSFTLHF